MLVVTLSLIFHFPFFPTSVLRLSDFRNLADTRLAPLPRPLATTLFNTEKKSKFKGQFKSLDIMATARQGKKKDPPVQTLQQPSGVSHVLQYLPHLSPKISFITHEFPAPPHLQFS